MDQITLQNNPHKQRDRERYAHIVFLHNINIILHWNTKQKKVKINLKTKGPTFKRLNTYIKPERSIQTQVTFHST